MADRRGSTFDPDRPALYRIKIKGRLDQQWADWFEGLAIELTEDGSTHLTGPVVDDTALHGLLKKVRDLGIPLISVNRIDHNGEAVDAVDPFQPRSQHPRPLMLWPLIAVLCILALGGGLYGGITMLLDPSGELLGVADALPLLPVPNFILPGIFLIVVMGLFPLLIAYGLVARPNWPWVDSRFGWSSYLWPWTGAVILVLILAAWLAIEGSYMGVFPITYITGGLGLLILLLTLSPGVRRYYARQDQWRNLL